MVVVVARDESREVQPETEGDDGEDGAEQILWATNQPSDGPVSSGLLIGEGAALIAVQTRMLAW
eukprot:CAMPEP_0185781550 /NCGR_PEP_ID=MMETSP1174-20130828/102834_1 /TAXON_ID=35687 /ORGANISM="Dictyocha speculum, Strain CCMP1381" /LENGTH=63 /DNA_ID=CAMNT_0028471571 /DNA_START=174 /DNA_END=365 /DNA_ORIENTATION=-